MSKLFKVFVSATMLAASATAVAAPTIYSGFDQGASGPGANATAAAAAFAAAVTMPQLETFEGFTVGSNTNGQAGPGYTLSSVAFDIRNATTCSNALCGNNTTAGGSRFAYSNAAAAKLTFNFTTPINAFGAYFGGVQTGTNALTWSDANGSHSVALNPQVSNGGYAFVGFYDPLFTVTSVTIDIPFDLISVDDVYYGATGPGGVPEPATWAMLIFGFGVIGVAKRSASRKVTHAIA